MKQKLDWMSLEEALVLQRLMQEAEARCLISIGLGWLVEFCSDSKKKKQ
jgi:hypothetical protein